MPLQTLKGFRDFLPEEKRKRDFLMKKIIEIFEIFGFEPLETPTLEYASLLLGKYGQEADKLIYSFKDRGGREIALKYDQTVPTARVLAQYQNILPKYFRRYQIQNVFRAEKPQKGRYREFTQCDIDIFGSNSSLADAEILAATYFSFKNIGFDNIILNLNDRKILFDRLKTIDKIDLSSLIQTIDKLEKIGSDKVIDELISKGLSRKQSKEALKAIESATISANLKEIINLTVNLGVPENAIKFSPALARGLDYYTGMIFEATLPQYKADSLAGGGRYDNLIKKLSGVDIPAVGGAFGFDRIVEAVEQLKIGKKENPINQILVTIFNDKTLTYSLKLTKKLREKKIRTEIYPGLDKLEKQLKYADKKGVPYVIILGPDEIKKNVVKLKNMKTGKQLELNQRDLILKLKSL